MWSIARSAYSRERAVVINVDEVATGAADRRLGAAATSARSRRAGGRPGTGALGGRADAEPGEGGGYGSGRWPYRSGNPSEMSLAASWPHEGLRLATVVTSVFL
jgi:hypothetical protein